MTRRPTPIVGTDVPEQIELRPSRPPRTLDDFLEFLSQLEAIFGPVERPSRPTTGDRFLL